MGSDATVILQCPEYWHRWSLAAGPVCPTCHTPGDMLDDHQRLIMPAPRNGDPLPQAALDTWQMLRGRGDAWLHAQMYYAQRLNDASNNVLRIALTSAQLTALDDLAATGIVWWWHYDSPERAAGASHDAVTWYLAFRGQLVTIRDIQMPRARLWTVCDALGWYLPTIWEEPTYESYLEALDAADTPVCAAQYRHYAAAVAALDRLWDAARASGPAAAEAVDRALDALEGQ